MQIDFTDVDKIVVKDVYDLSDMEPFRVIDIYSEEGRTRIFLHAKTKTALKFKRGRNG